MTLKAKILLKMLALPSLMYRCLLAKIPHLIVHQL
jgi:hypothetical protein